MKDKGELEEDFCAFSGAKVTAFFRLSKKSVDFFDSLREERPFGRSSRCFGIILRLSRRSGPG